MGLIVIKRFTLVMFCFSNGSLQALSDNIKYARTKTPQELGIKVNSIFLINAMPCLNFCPINV